MRPLKIDDPQLSSAVQETLRQLLQCGCRTAGKHQFTEQELSSRGLSIAALGELVRTGLVETVDQGGTVLRHMTPVATEVQAIYASGDVLLTLAVDLVD